MNLYLIKLTGSHALETKVVRAKNSVTALRLADIREPCDDGIFDKMEIRILFAEGDEGLIFEASFVE